MPYTFTTSEGNSFIGRMTVRAPADAYTLTAEFTKHPYNEFKSEVPFNTAPVESDGKNLTLTLTADEVDALGEAYFRIKAVKDEDSIYIERGKLEYNRNAIPPRSIGLDRLGFDPATQAELDATIRTDEQVAALAKTAVGGDIENLLPDRLNDVALRAASVTAVEDAETVAPAGAWDFAQAPTVAGVPVGSGGGGGAGTVGRGYAVPQGALDVWKAARDNSANQRAEAVVFGDSTTFGAEAGNANYSWLQRVRDRLASAGFASGGKGLFGVNEGSIVYDAPEVNGLVSKTGWSVNADASGVYVYLAEDFISNIAGDALNLQGRGQEVEIIYARRGGQTGDFTYSVDGAATTKVVAAQQGSGSSGSILPVFGRVVVPIAGAARDSLHTLTITNRGGTDGVAPTLGTPGVQGSPGQGTYPAGTWWYAATAVFPNGQETPVGNKVSFTNGANTDVGGNFPFIPGASSHKVYRSDTQNGTYSEIVGAITGSTEFVAIWKITGASTFGGQPPVGGTVAFNNGLTRAIVAVGFRNTAGILFQKYARTGATLTEMFDPLRYYYGQSDGTPFKWQGPLGLVQTVGTPNVAPPFTWGVARDTTPGAPRPALAILHLGFNNMSNFPRRWLSGTTYSTNQVVGFGGAFWQAVTGSNNVKPGTDITKWLPYDVGANYPLDMFAAAIQEFCRAARSAGADPLIVSGQYPLNVNALEWGGQVAQTVRETALACGAAWVDFMEALGAPNQWGSNGVAAPGNPHLTKAGYQRQADFLWDNILSA